MKDERSKLNWLNVASSATGAGERVEREGADGGARARVSLSAGGDDGSEGVPGFNNFVDVTLVLNEPAVHVSLVHLGFPHSEDGLDFLLLLRGKAVVQGLQLIKVFLEHLGQPFSGVGDFDASKVGAAFTCVCHDDLAHFYHNLNYKVSRSR